MADAEVISPSPQRSPSPTKRVTLSGRRSPDGSRGSHRSGTPGSGGRRTPGTPEYMRPVVRSAVQRWKRVHEQIMMEKLVDVRNEKKNEGQVARLEAQQIARKIPVELLAKEWLNDNQATLEARAYLVDKVLPTLILGVEKLLNEVEKKELADMGVKESNFNPLNFLAQYMMRNNPRYSNLSEASPYARGLRAVSEDLRRQLFEIEDNRLARVKAEARRRREERERNEQLRLEEFERRQKAFMAQFAEWNASPDGKVELSLLQNALRSFLEIIESFPEDIRKAAEFSHPLEPTDESGKVLMVKEFAEYLAKYVEDMPREIFDAFMTHMAKCARSARIAGERENRRIALTNLFISCDHSGIGLLDRHRILGLFEGFWDTYKDEIKSRLRNPRKWPVVEVDEEDDALSDEDDLSPEQGEEQTADAAGEEEKPEGEKGDITQEELRASPTGEKEEIGEKDKTVGEEEKVGEVKQEDGEKEKIEADVEKSEEKADDKTDSSEKTTEGEAEVKPDDKAEESKDAEGAKEEDEQKVGQEEMKEKEQVTDEATKEETTNEVEKSEADEKKDDEKGEETTEKDDKEEKKVEEPKSEGKEEGIQAEADMSEKEQAMQGVGEKEQDEADPGEDLVLEGDDFPPPTAGTDGPPPTTAGQTGRGSVSFAEGTAFDRERTALSTAMTGRTSAASCFDENSVSVSQFVQLTETFLGDEPQTDGFNQLLKHLKEGYEETEEEKMDRLVKARQEALTIKRKMVVDHLFEKWDNDGSGYLDLDEVETIMLKYKDGQEHEAIQKAKKELKKNTKHHDNRLSKREFRQFVNKVIEEMPGDDTFDYFTEFLFNSVERSYADRIRGEARKKWLQQIVTAAETGGASMESVYKSVFQALYKDAEAHGGDKRISANIAMLERNTQMPDRGDVCLRYVAATPEDAEFVLGMVLYKDMKGISFPAVESGKPIHVPRVANHGNIQFWNPHRKADEKEGSFIVVPLKDRRKRVFGLLGVDTLSDYHSKAIFITHEIQFFQGVAKAFSIAYHHVDMRKKLLRITESAISWIQRRSPHVREITAFMVEPDVKGTDYILRKMMTTDKRGNIQHVQNPPRMERKDNLFRDYLFNCIDNSESVAADAYGERHLGFPLRDDQGRAVAAIDLSIGELRQLPTYENKEVMRMLRLLQQAHKEITKEFAGEDKTMVLEAEKNDDARMDIMFDRLMLMELRENVSKIDGKTFAELRSYNEPPAIVHKILKATCSLFFLEKVEEGEMDDWTTLKSYINSELLSKISRYDPTATEDQDLIPPDKVEIYLRDVPHGEVSKYGSVPAQHLYNWVFVCLSLIEHTRKMRENSEENALPPVQEAEAAEQEQEEGGEKEEELMPSS